MSKKKKLRNSGKDKNTNVGIQHCTYYVEGMHCSSCEIMIEKKLLKQPSVESVDASLKEKKVEIYFKDQKPNIELVNKDLKKLGYQLTTKKHIKKERPFISFRDNGAIEFNGKKLKNILRTGVVLVSLIIAFFVFEDLQLGRYASVTEESSLPAFFMLGLVAGLSSCAALVGGLLLSMTKQWNELYIDADSNYKKAQPHIMFHIGRLLSFALLGGVLGLLGNVISLDNPVIYAILVILISLVMVILALQMLGVEWAQGFSFTAPKALTREAADESNFKGRQMPFIIGFATFLLPCGFTLIAQTLALTSGSFIQGSLIMTFFVFGTLPMLMGISLTGLQFNSSPRLTAKFNQVVGLLLIFFAIYNINGQLNVLNLPSLSDIDLSGIDTTEDNLNNSVAEVNNGVQELKMIAKGFEYTPTSPTTLKAGVPTRMIVNNQGISGCGAFMTGKGLFSGSILLEPGENIVEFTPKIGTYKVTCTMGMVPPVIIRVI